MINVDFSINVSHYKLSGIGNFLDRVVTLICANPAPLIISIIAIARIIFYHYFPISKQQLPTLNQDVLEKIFEELDLKKLLSVSTVCKEWNELIKDDLLIKKIIYQKNTINPLHWNKFFGTNTIADEEIQKAFQSLPCNIYEILKSSTASFPAKMIMDTHMFVWIPKTIKGKPLSINTFKELLKGNELFCNSNGYQYIWPEIINQIGEKPIKQGFMLMSKALLPESLNKSYVEQKDLVDVFNQDSKISWKIPTLSEAVIGIYLNYLKTGASAFKDKSLVYTRCEEKIDDRQLIAGSFDSSGLYIGSCDNVKYDFIGVSLLSYIDKKESKLVGQVKERPASQSIEK